MLRFRAISWSLSPGPVRLGQILVPLRYDLRRGAAALMSRACPPMRGSFLNIQDKPDVESIDGLYTAIAIDQKTTCAQPALHGRHRSRKFTITCACFTPASAFPIPRPRAYPIESQTVSQMVDRILELPGRYENPAAGTHRPRP